MFVLFFLGGAIPSLFQVLFLKLINTSTGEEVAEEVRREAFEKLLPLRFDYAPDEAHHLSASPSVLFWFLYRGMFYVLPVLVLLIGFDQLSGEIQHRSIRYLAGRSRRGSIVVGKAIGVWAVIAVMVLVLDVTVWIVMLIRGGYAAGNVLSWGLRFWAYAVADAAAYVGLTAVVSSLVRTPIVALFAGGAILIALWMMSGILGFFDATHNATWAFAGNYDKLLNSPEPARIMGGIVALIAWGAMWVMAAVEITRRRDL